MIGGKAGMKSRKVVATALVIILLIIAGSIVYFSYAEEPIGSVTNPFIGVPKVQFS